MPLTPSPGAILTEMPKMSGRRDGGEPLLQVLDLVMERASDEPTSLQMPALIEATVVGRDINSIAVVAGRYEVDGTKRLVTFEPVELDSAKKVWPIQWADGIHELSYVWYTEGDFLSDGDMGDFVLLWQIEPDSNLRTINGRFRRSDDSDFMDSVLVVDILSGQASELLDTKTGKAILPGPGDQFQVIDLLLDDLGAIVTSPGVNLTFGESAELMFERKTLSRGDYFLGFITEGGAGNADSAYANFTVSNENLLPDLRAYLQPEHGYQFLYPLAWSNIADSGQGVLIVDNEENIELQVVVDTNPDQISASSIKKQAMNNLGNIQVLYEDQVQIGSLAGLRTIYGYQSPAGPHTGLFVGFEHDGREYIVDVDGSSSVETTILNVMETIIDSWIWRPIPAENQVDSWKSIDIDGYQIAVPDDLQHALLKNGWHRFSENGGNTFFAIQIESQEDGDLDARMAHWLEVAGRNIGSFIGSNIYEYEFSDRPWLRFDFQYDDEESGERWGAILSAELGGNHIIAWFEAPEADFIQMEENLVTLTLADLLSE